MLRILVAFSSGEVPLAILVPSLATFYKMHTVICFISVQIYAKYFHVKMICEIDSSIRVSQSFSKLSCQKFSCDFCIQNLFYDENEANYGKKHTYIK